MNALIDNISASPIRKPQPGAELKRLPLVTLYLTDRCNSRCVTCDYWRHGRVDMNLERVTRLLPSLTALQTQLVLISGGEPLIHPQWVQIAQLLRARGLKLWLLTSGLSLEKHAQRVSELFDAVTVSLDGTCGDTYKAIRGVDAFDKVCSGIQAAAALGVSVSVRVTLQRANYSELPQFVSLSRQIGAREVSFLAADVASPHAFGRLDGFSADVALRPDDLPVFEQLLCALEREHEADFRSGLIAESPQKLRRILQYFSAVCGSDSYPQVRCNAPEFSAVISATGVVSPCFFIPGPDHAAANSDLGDVLNSPPMTALRQTIREGHRTECSRCVCSMWRDLSS